MADIRQAMTDIATVVDVKPAERASKFLGIHISDIRIHGDWRYIHVNQAAYANHLIERYCRDAGMGGHALPQTATPYIEDDIKVDEELSPGVMGWCARCHIGGLLFLMRGSRGDLANAIGRMGRHVTCWSKADDKRLRRVFQYLAGTLETGVLMVMHKDDAGDFWMQAYTDSDHAGDRMTGRSTSGGTRA